MVKDERQQRRAGMMRLPEFPVVAALALAACVPGAPIFGALPAIATFDFEALRNNAEPAPTADDVRTQTTHAPGWDSAEEQE